jgi:hypothetical protein
MEDRILITVEVINDALQVKIEEESYGNLALVGVLEKIKLNILNDLPIEKTMESNNPDTKETFQKYDA